ncbi:MAG TPA: DUF1707 domain-containing protein [Streptosporangiaceae bacterium]|nr:DUF1707 domain-containing protein [Streptosporangiaceae bacterium]
MTAQPFGDNPRLRASDADRDRAASVLNGAMAEGRLTADEHSDRLDALYAAKTHAEIVPLLDDLPGRTTAASPAKPSGEVSHIVAILSGATRTGSWTAPPAMNVVSVLGGVELDFREATLPAGDITISAVCVLGGLEITVPPEMHVVDNGVAILGGREITADSDESGQPGAPVLRIKGFCFLGGVEVKRKARKSQRDRSRRRGIES